MSDLTVNNVTLHKALRKGSVNDWDWTAAVDGFLRHVDGLSEREIEERWGFSDTTINRWRKLREGGEDVPAPRGPNRVRLVRFTKHWPGDEEGFVPRHGVYDSVPPTQHEEESPEQAVAGNMPDVRFLHPRAREIYDRAVGSYVTRRWPPPIVERAAWDLVNYIIGANSLRSAGPGRPELTEEEQCMVLERTVERVERAYGPNGVVRRF